MKTIFNTKQDRCMSIKKQTSKIIRYLWIFAVLFASCNKNLEVDITPEESVITANIDISGIVKNFKNVDGTNLFVNGTIEQDRFVEVRFSIYDENGSAIITETVSLQDFSKKESITKTVKNGEYTIVACAYISDKNDEAEFWKPENINDLYSYWIKYSPGSSKWIGTYGVLGVWEKEVAINESQSVNINISPVVSMVYFYFTNCDVAGIKKIQLNVKSFNDYFDVAKMQGVINEQNTYTYEKNITTSTTTWAICYFPISKFSISWKGFDADGKEINNGDIPSSALTAGETKVITIETQTLVPSLIPESTYTATVGTPRFFNTGPTTWKGEIIFDDTQSSQYYVITNFFDDDWVIFADYKNEKIFLDDYTSLWEGTLTGLSGTFQAYLSYGVLYNGSYRSIPMKDPVEIKYNESTKILDFSNKISFDFGGSIGVVNNLSLYVGILAKPKSGTGAGTDNYWISDVYPDIKLQLTPKSPQQLSSKSVHKNTGISRSRFTPSSLVISNKVIMVDKPLTTPVDEMKFEDTKDYSLQKTKNK